MYHILVNASRLDKKHSKKLAVVENVFKNAGLGFTVHKTGSEDEVKSLTREITSGQGEVVVVMGGDGTLHQVLNSFVDFENNAMAVIPFGTGNDFAAAVRIPNDVEKAAKIVAEGKIKNIDFIQLSSGVRSLNAVGMGIDVDVLKRTYAGKSTKKSKYLKALIVSLAKFKSYDFTLEFDGKSEEHFGLIAAVGNGRQIGGGITIFPDAEVDDGYMELFIADYISKFKTIGAFIKLMTGKVKKVKQTTTLRVKKVKFIPHAPLTIQADGELYDMPLEAEIAEKKLKFILA